MAQPKLTLVGAGAANLAGARRGVSSQPGASRPARASHVALGCALGLAIGFGGIVVAMLPIAQGPAMLALGLAFAVGLVLLQRADPATQRENETRVGGAFVGGGIVLVLMAVAVMASGSSPAAAKLVAALVFALPAITLIASGVLLARRPLD